MQQKRTDGTRQHCGHYILAYISDMKALLTRPIKLLMLAILSAMLIAGLFWQNLMFASAVVNSESLPALLRDAEWGTPVPAFREQFSSGVPETELLSWLSENGFELDGTGSASLTIHALPCNERVEVSWTAVDEIIRESSAVVREAGCL